MRYERLLEGLEIAERKLAELERTGRIDAEFFQHRHLAVEAKLSARSCESVAQLAYVSDGNHFSISESFVDEGVPYYRGQDAVGHFFIEQAAPNKITRKAFEQPYMRRSHLQQGDVLLSIIGTVGETSLVKTKQEATCSCKLAILRPKNIDPAYLAAYLSSRIGRSLTERWKRGTVQTGLLLEDMDQLPVPRFSELFEAKVAAAVGKAYEALEARQRSFEDAETTLLQALGLENWQAPEPRTYVRSSRDAFTAGRLDAEHFQEKFFAAKQALIAAGARRFIPLPDLLETLTNGHTPLRHDLSVGKVPFLCAEHVTDFNISFESEKRILLEHHEKELARTAVRDGDVLLTIKGRIGNAAIAENVPGPININQDVALLRFNHDLDVWYIVAYLNSRFGKLQSEKMSTGAINPFIGLFNIQQFEVPEFSRDVMQGVAVQTRAHVTTSHQAKQRADKLLDVAKHAVEIAIEDTETAAMGYLKDVVS